MDHATGVSNVNLGSAVLNAATEVKSSFTKMKKEAYEQYLEAHQSWYNTVVRTQMAEHNRALTRRAMQKYREVVEPLTDEQSTARAEISGGSYVIPGSGDDDDDEELAFSVKLEKKVAHPPTLSTHPHEGEKRANKKKLRDNRTKRQAAALQAKANIVSEDTEATIQARLAQVKKVADLAPLHAVEEKAAKSAAKRSRTIKFGSTNVSEVNPSDWSVVARQGWRDIADVKHIDANQVHKSTVRVSGMPGMINPGRILAASAKAPQTVGAK